MTGRPRISTLFPSPPLSLSGRKTLSPPGAGGAGPAGQVSADGHPDHCGGLEVACRAPAQYAQLIPELHHCGPDVIEELDFGHGLEATRGHADGTAHDAGLSDGRIEDTVRAEAPL